MSIFIHFWGSKSSLLIQVAFATVFPQNFSWINRKFPYAPRVFTFGRPNFDLHAVITRLQLDNNSSEFHQTDYDTLWWFKSNQTLSFSIEAMLRKLLLMGAYVSRCSHSSFRGVFEKEKTMGKEIVSNICAGVRWTDFEFYSVAQSNVKWTLMERRQDVNVSVKTCKWRLGLGAFFGCESFLGSFELVKSSC
jgi:midasin (ATPase involved in ribosome maturation)